MGVAALRRGRWHGGDVRDRWEQYWRSVRRAWGVPHSPSRALGRQDDCWLRGEGLVARVTRVSVERPIVGVESCRAVVFMTRIIMVLLVRVP